MSCVLKSQQKEAISTLFSGKDLFAVLPTGFRKSLIFQVLVCKKVIMTGKLRAQLSFLRFIALVMIKWSKHLRSD